MNNSFTEQSPPRLLPSPHRHWPWLLLVVFVVAGALVWWGLVRESADAPPPVTMERIQERSAKMIVRLRENTGIRTVALEPDGSGVLFVRRDEGDPGRSESIELSPSVVRDVAGLWFQAGFYQLPAQTGAENGVAIELFMDVGGNAHVVSCAGRCSQQIHGLVQVLVEQLPQEQQGLLEALTGDN